MEDEKLIALVESNKELYDKSNPYYKYTERKKMLWEQIAKELHTNGELCMRRRSALRDRYGREVRKTIAPSGSAAEYYRPWHLLEALQFLKPHIVPRPLRCSQNICSVVSSASTPVAVNLPSPNNVPLPSPLPPNNVPLPLPSPPIIEDFYSPSPSITMSLPSPSSPIVVPSPELSPLPSTSSPSPATSQKEHSRSGKRRGSNTDVDRSMYEAIELFKNRCLAREEENTNPSLHYFGNMITSLISKMSAAKQSRAMQRMMQVALEVQLEPE